MVLLIYKRKNHGKKYFQETTILQTGIEAKDTILKALENAGFKNIPFIAPSTTFWTDSGVSLWSWSENITVKLLPSGNKTALEFLSKCALPTQIIDWGKNKKNAATFFYQLE